MYNAFLDTFEKISQEDLVKKRTVLKTMADITPWVLGFGAGAVASDVLKQQLTKVKNPSLKNTTKILLPFVGGALSYMVLPKLHEKLKQTLAGTTHDKPKT